MYSKKRLFALGVVWLIAGAAVFAISPPQFGVNADPRGCDNPRCAFPAESNIGGIVLGTDQLIGQGLKSFGVGDTQFDDVAPGRVDPREKYIGLGINDITAENFFIYKQWYYPDTRTRSEAPVYVWANATEARLTGTPECGNGNEGFGGASDCDLLANTSELATKYINAETNCDGTVPILGGIACGIVNGVSPLEINNYHAVRVEEDTCGTLGALNGIVCLELIKDGGVQPLGLADVTADEVEAYDLQLRGHVIQAVNKGGNGNKVLTLTDAYVEIRYGKGFDRVYTPVSSPSDPSNNYGPVVGSNPDWAQPTQGPTGVSALGTNFTCSGGGPNTVCGIPEGRSRNIPGQSYDNIYR